MHTLLVAAGSVVGVATGMLLDPVGQRLADGSRAAEERRRAERAERPAADATPDADAAAAGPAPVPELDDAGPSADAPPAPPPDTTAAEPDGRVRHLLPEGTSLARTLGAGLVTGLLFGLTADRLTVHGHGATLLLVLPYWVFLAMAVTVSVTDLTHRLVPRQLLFGALALIVPLLVIVSAHLHAWRPLLDAAAAGLVAFAVFFVVWFVVPRGMGYGDVRLAGVIGVAVGYLGLLEAYVAFLTGFVLGLVFGLVLMVTSGTGRRTRIPFAPALCIGAAVAVVWGAPIAHHVFHASS